jgi:hypothetical protein
VVKRAAQKAMCKVGFEGGLSFGFYHFWARCLGIDRDFVRKIGLHAMVLESREIWKTNKTYEMIKMIFHSSSSSSTCDCYAAVAERDKNGDQEQV